jgi:hypothetical protein
MSIAVLPGPVADLSAVEFEGTEAQGFGSGEAVRARGRAGEPFFEQVQDRLRPPSSMVAAGTARGPEMGLFLSTSMGVSGGQNIEAATRETKLVSGIASAEGVLVKRLEGMADEAVGVTVE